MSYGKFEDIDDSIKELCKLSEFMSHSDLASKLKHMSDKERVSLAATINELSHYWCELKGIRHP